MALSDEAPVEDRERVYYICPACGKRYTLKRRYCDCHTKLDTFKVYATDDQDAVIGEDVNVEFLDFTCADCEMGCKRCYSFSAPRRNHRGFGGEDCYARQDSLRCSCCQAIQRGPWNNIRKIVVDLKEMWRRRDEG